jgi:hypothetical protein
MDQSLYTTPQQSLTLSHNSKKQKKIFILIQDTSYKQAKKADEDVLQKYHESVFSV